MKAGEDQITQIIGEVGPFQFFWWATISFSTILHSLAMMSNKFQLYRVDFWCERQGNYWNSSVNDWLHVAAPKNEDNSFDRCRIYYDSFDGKTRMEKRSITSCVNWEYDTSYFEVRKKENIYFWLTHRLGRCTKGQKM